MKKFKVVVLARSGNAKYTYKGSFPDMYSAVRYYETNGGRVIEIKEVGVRLKAA